MREKSYKAALGGVMTAMALVFLLLGAFFPFSTYAAPAAAALCVAVFHLELGTAAALTMYAAVSLLALLLGADKEAAFLFTMLLGYYPVLKRSLDRLRSRAVRIALKLAVANVSVAAMYLLLLKILALPVMVADFADFNAVMAVGFAVMGNITVLLFDTILTRFAFLYWAKIRPRLCRRNGR